MRQVGEGNQDAGADEEEDEEEGGEGVPVEDMAATTFKGHSDAVYCVAVNPKNPSQVWCMCMSHDLSPWSWRTANLL